MAKTTRSASTGRFTATSTSARVPASVSKSASSSAAPKSISPKATPSKSTPSKSAAPKVASKTSGKGASKNIARSARTGRRTSEVRDAAHRLRVDTFGPVDSLEIQRLDELVTDADEITVVGRDNRQVPVAGALLQALATVTGAMGRGATFTVTEAGQVDTELTSQEAADLLNVSRPYVVKLARDGVLPHHRVGNRHRFALADVLEHRGRMRATTEEALIKLAPADGYTAADF